MPRLADTGRFSCWKGTNSYTEAVITFRKKWKVTKRSWWCWRNGSKSSWRCFTSSYCGRRERNLFRKAFSRITASIFGCFRWSICPIRSQGFKNGHFEVIVKNCTRKNRGRYLIIAENNQGRSYSITNVNVLDVPGCPQEPWPYTEPWFNAISLEWNSPEDGGGPTLPDSPFEEKNLSALNSVGTYPNQYPSDSI